MKRKLVLVCVAPLLALLVAGVALAQFEPTPARPKGERSVLEPLPPAPPVSVGQGCGKEGCRCVVCECDSCDCQFVAETSTNEMIGELHAELKETQRRLAELEKLHTFGGTEGASLRGGTLFLSLGDGDTVGLGKYPAPGFNVVGERPLLWSTPIARAKRGDAASVFALKEDGYQWQDRETGDVVFVKWRDIAEAVHGKK